MAIYARDAPHDGAAQKSSNSSRADSVQAKEGNLLSKYMVISKKGEGTFSEVLECRNRSSDESVAVKKLKQRYDSIYQCNKIREVQAMRKLCNHANIVKLKEMIYEPTSCTLYLVLELMDMNLYELIRGKRHYLPESRIRFYMLQLVDAVRHMHKHGIFHRDVKPENILVKSDLLKLADFGSCRSRESKQPYTEYISTRWYRAPECLLTDGYYDYKMDVWSVGCVFFEISTLKPLFPGQNEIDQIDKIHKLLGTPPPEVLGKFRRSRSMSFNFPPNARDEKTLTHLTEPMPGDGIDLMYKMLEYDPSRRTTMEDSLQHNYLKTLSEQLKAQREAKRAAQAANGPANEKAATDENAQISSRDKKAKQRKMNRGRDSQQMQPTPYYSKYAGYTQRHGNQPLLSHSFNPPAYHAAAPGYQKKVNPGGGPGGLSGTTGISGLQLPYIMHNQYQLPFQKYQSELKKKPPMHPSTLPKIEG